MSLLTVLMVAEKPSIALTLSEVLCGGQRARKRMGVSKSSPVYEYEGQFRGNPCLYKVTATTGHIYSLDFSSECNDWNKVSPGDLFHATTVRCYDPRANIPGHIQAEAKGAGVLVLWLDCDREGENICFEVMGEALPNMMRGVNYPDAWEGNVFRAHFSSLSAVDLQHAMANLITPDLNMSHSVDARQEIDLRLGVAFSRLQTTYFRTHFGNQLGKKMVTYGPCQFPTLWFCIKRHCEITAFVPQPFWRLAITTSLQGAPFKCVRVAGDIWDAQAARGKKQEMKAVAQSGARIKSVRSWRSRLDRPLPLNTVALLKLASEELGIGPGDSMHLAEQLYLKGVLSYPRTETDKYPDNFDLQGLARTISPRFATESATAAHIQQGHLTAPRADGTDVGDHPPITPVKLASQSQCGGEAGYALFNMICTHFLATISPDAIFDEAEVTLEMGGELFAATSSRCSQKGWMELDDRDTSDEGAIDLRLLVGHEGETAPVSGVELSDHMTQPPRHLTESELLALMDRHGIGTDASMAQHVSNVEKRSYVVLDESTRELIPTALGLALAHGYALIDQTLLLPSVRARIENECNSVAKGLATKDVVIRRTIRIFEKKFYTFAMRIDKLPLMLAVAYAQERGSAAVAGDAAGEGLQLWRQAEMKHQAVTLDQLLVEKERVELDEEGGDELQPGSVVEIKDLQAAALLNGARGTCLTLNPNGRWEVRLETGSLAGESKALWPENLVNLQASGTPPTRDGGRSVQERTEAVRRVQQALQELGFPAADAAPEQPRGKGQGKANLRGGKGGGGRGGGGGEANAPPGPYQPPVQSGLQPPLQPGLQPGLQPPPGYGAASGNHAALESKIVEELSRRGGQMDLSQLSGLCPGVKKQDIQKLRAIALVPGDNGRCTVVLRS